jgi:hypothetical protein
VRYGRGDGSPLPWQQDAEPPQVLLNDYRNCVQGGRQQISLRIAERSGFPDMRVRVAFPP